MTVASAIASAFALFCVVFALPALAQHAGHDSVAAGPPNATIAVKGPDAQALSVDAALMAALPRQKVTQSFHGETHVFEGPLLAAIVGRAGAPIGQKLRGKELTTIVLLRARDGYQAALSLGEIDPAMSGDMVILADRADGQPLADADGPYRLVISGDKVAARSARMIESIEIRRLP